MTYLQRQALKLRREHEAQLGQKATAPAPKGEATPQQEQDHGEAVQYSSDGQPQAPQGTGDVQMGQGISSQTWPMPQTPADMTPEGVADSPNAV